ncbi:unnamed protein product [Rangifer tarandus platyrhynchus]|uniref:Uncharacterized protein n=1 Tax=Rangifer tarandus platyrhynchus TaxID=3082113 RepID=A0ACB1KHE2_RANTA
MYQTAVDMMWYDSPGFPVHKCVGVSALRIPKLQQTEAVALNADALLLVDDFLASYFEDLEVYFEECHEEDVMELRHNLFHFLQPIQESFQALPHKLQGCIRQHQTAHSIISKPSF